MTLVPLLGRIGTLGRSLLRPVLGSVTSPEDVRPVEFEAPDLAAQLVPDVYRPLGTTLGAVATDERS